MLKKTIFFSALFLTSNVMASELTKAIETSFLAASKLKPKDTVITGRVSVEKDLVEYPLRGEELELLGENLIQEKAITSLNGEFHFYAKLKKGFYEIRLAKSKTACSKMILVEKNVIKDISINCKRKIVI